MDEKQFLDVEIKHIGWHTIERLAKQTRRTPADFCRLIGIQAGTHIENLRSGVRRLTRAQRIALYLFDALYEQTPMFSQVAMQKTRSYWKGWHDSGGQIPQEYDKYNFNLDEIPVSVGPYMNGVKDYRETVNKKEEHDN